ncbi:MAG TPA: gas vesicle protein [Terriglobales bacterium]|nr:gas vesicle protein [Terriglobales bacterium]
MERVPAHSGTTNLIDILDRVLDKGLVVAGDIRVSLANVELLTIRIRLLVCSVDKAEQIGLNWWKYDPNLTMQSGPPVNRMGLPPGSRFTRRAVKRTVVEAPVPIRKKTIRTVKSKKKSKRG